MTQAMIPGMMPQAAAVAPVATAAVAPAMAAQVAQVETPATAEVAQMALPADFQIMQFAVHKEKAESSSARKPVWECTVEELRERVTFRDVQAPSNRNTAEYHLRPFLSPKSLPLEEVLGNDGHGNPINTIIIPAQYADGAKEQFLAQVVAAGYMDQILLRTAQEIKVAKDERDAAPKKAPVDTGAADAALADLEAMNAAAVPAGVVPAGVPAGVLTAAPVAAAPAAAAPMQTAAVPAGVPAMPAMPAGMPAGVPGFPG